MTTRTLSWTLDAPGPRQAPVARTEIYFRADPSLEWTFQDSVPAAAPQEMVFENVQPGTMFYQAIVFDTFDTPSLPAEASANIPFDPPNAPANFTIVDTP